MGDLNLGVIRQRNSLSIGLGHRGLGPGNNGIDLTISEKEPGDLYIMTKYSILGLFWCLIMAVLAKMWHFSPTFGNLNQLCATRCWIVNNHVNNPHILRYTSKKELKTEGSINLFP